MGSPQDICCVCSKKASLYPHLTFVPLPLELNNKKFEKWTSFLAKCKVKRIDKQIKDSNLRICSLHFAPDVRINSFNFFPTIKPKNKYNERKCSVPFCLNDGYDVPIMHNFPSDETLTLKWLKQFKMKKDTSKDYIACSEHFVKENYRPNKSKTYPLNLGTIPTRNLPFESHETQINQQYEHLTDVFRPFTEKLLELQSFGIEISEVEFKSALMEIAGEVKFRILRKARAEEFADLCRVCLMHIQPITSISDLLEDNITIADELEKILDLNKNSIRVGDELPQKLCNVCLQKSSEDLKVDCLESISIMQENFEIEQMDLDVQEDQLDIKPDILEETINHEYDLLDFILESKSSNSSIPRDCKTYLYALKCYICNLNFDSDVERMQHFQINHKTTMNVQSFESSMVRCRICKSTVSADAVPLNKHYRTHYESISLLCNFCGETNFGTVSKYHMHLRKHKSDEYEREFVKKLLLEQSPIVLEPIVEVIPDQILQFPDKNSDMPSPKKENSQKYLCDLCGQKDFKYKRLYNLHLRQHKDKRRIENKVSKKLKK